MFMAGRRKSIAFYIAFGIGLISVILVLYIGWVVLKWQQGALLVLGILLVGIIIGGVILNTISLVREIHRNEQKDAFINAVTHELKTPITSIRLYLETLQRLNLPEAKRREFYAMMLQDSEWLLATVEQVLKAGELGQRTQNQVRRPVDMQELVIQCVERTRARHHLDEVAIVFEQPEAPAPMMVRGNREELESVVLNLLNNSVKYSPNTVEIRVTLSIKNEAWIVLTVTDRGIGIPTSQLKRIFKRFYRVPARNVLKTKGTGLGLFIVRSIARQHGGDAFAESPGEGRGATVSVQLPRVLRPAAKELEREAQ